MGRFTVCFFGHREIRKFREAEASLEALIRTLLLQKTYVHFLVGREGDFDQLVSSVIKRQQRCVRADNSALIWILPYSTAQLRDQAENFLAYYDAVEICRDAACSPPKAAFQVRNRQMVDQSDLVVVYVEHQRGGAYQAMHYAQKQKKQIINLAVAR